MKFTLLRGACITTICLTTQSLQPADKKITTKKKPLPWLSQTNQDPYADDYDKYTPWQRNKEKIKTLQTVAKIVAEVKFSVHSSLDLLREVFKLILLLPKQKPLSHLSQDWTETFDDDQSNRHKTSDRARQKNI